jgi:proteasome lid subunit RPN8/RPN11
MIYYFTLRLCLPSGSSIYETDLRLSSLDTAVQNLLVGIKRQGYLRPSDIVRVVVKPAFSNSLAAPSIVNSSDGASTWEDAQPTEINWLGIHVEDDQLDRLVAYLHLTFLFTPVVSEGNRALCVDVPLDIFQTWFDTAETLLASTGMSEPVQRQVLLRKGEIFSEREWFPALADEIKRMGGELASYDVNSLEVKPMPAQKKKIRSLLQDQEQGIVIFVREIVLVNLVKLARAFPDREVGGLLVGQAYVAQDTGKLFITIDDFIKSKFSFSDRTLLHFSHKDSQWFSQEMEKRHKGQQTLGWYHTHIGDAFASKTDYTFHSNSWQAPWHVMLVLGHAGNQMLFFHWKDSQLSPLSSFYTYS